MCVVLFCQKTESNFYSRTKGFRYLNFIEIKLNHPSDTFPESKLAIPELRNDKELKPINFPHHEES